jgi:hypothetical protein
MSRYIAPLGVLVAVAALGCSDLTSPNSITIQKEPAAAPPTPQQPAAPGDVKPAAAPGGVVPANLPAKQVLEPAGPNGCG